MPSGPARVRILGVMSHYPPLPHYPPPPPARPSTGIQTAALILGILGFVTCGLAGLAAILVGHIAFSEAKRRPYREGYGAALAGLILGYISAGMVAAYIVLVVLSA